MKAHDIIAIIRITANQLNFFIAFPPSASFFSFSYRLIFHPARAPTTENPEPVSFDDHIPPFDNFLVC